MSKATRGCSLWPVERWRRVNYITVSKWKEYPAGANRKSDPRRQLIVGGTVAPRELYYTLRRKIFPDWSFMARKFMEFLILTAQPVTTLRAENHKPENPLPGRPLHYEQKSVNPKIHCPVVRHTTSGNP